MTDWNWFFSALAQSAAAIVGIFTAFIITKIVNNQSTFNQKNREFDSLLLESKTLKAKVKNRKFKYHNAWIRNEQIEELEKILLKEEKYSDPEDYYSRLRFSPYDSQSEVLEVIKSKINEFKGFNELEIRQKTNELYPGEHVTITYRSVYQQEEFKEEGLINSLRVDTMNHIEKIKLFLKDNSSNPESSSLISGSIIGLLVLFYVGVIYPLSFLPLNDIPSISFSLGLFFKLLFTLRGILLLVVSVIFSVIMVVFLRINKKLKYEKGKLDSLYKRTDISDYSEYFRYFEEKTG